MSVGYILSQFFLQMDYDGLIPARRQVPTVENPSAPCFKMNASSASESLLDIIFFHFFPAKTGQLESSNLQWNEMAGKCHRDHPSNASSFTGHNHASKVN